VSSFLKEVDIVEIFEQVVLVSSKGRLHKTFSQLCGVTHFQVINNVITVDVLSAFREAVAHLEKAWFPF
jgi:hypothetical protein